MPIPFLPQGLCPCCSVCLEPPPQTLGLVISLPSGLSSHVTFLGRPSWSILAKGGFYSLSDFFFVRGFLVYFHQSTFQNMNVCLLICLYIFLPFVSKHHSLPPPHKLGACLQYDTYTTWYFREVSKYPDPPSSSSSPSTVLLGLHGIVLSPQQSHGGRFYPHATSEETVLEKVEDLSNAT